MKHNPENAGQIGSPNMHQPARGRLFRTLAFAFCHNGCLSAGRLAVPIVALDLSISKAEIGILAALFTLVPILANIPYGRWVDRVGSLLPARIATGTLIVGTVILVIHPAIETMVVSAVLVGAGAAFSHLAIARAVGGEADSQRRVYNLSRLAVAYSSCQFLMPMLTGVAYDLGGARGAFTVLAVLAVMSLLILERGKTMLTRPPAAAARSPVRRRMVDLVRVPGMPRILFLSSIFWTGIVFYALAAPLHGTEIGLSASGIGALYGMFAAGSLFSRLIAAWISRRLAEFTLLAVCLLLGGLACVIIPIFSNWAPLAAVTFVLGACMGMGQPIIMTLTYGVAPQDRTNEAVGLVMTISNVTQLGTPLLFGVIAESWGAGPMIWAFGAMLLAASAIEMTRLTFGKT